MRQSVVGVVTLLLGLAACGGDDQPVTPDGPPGVPDAPPVTPDADDRDLLVRLNDLPGVVAVEETDPGGPPIRLFDLTITQPVDQLVPGGPTFEQNVTLVHRGFDRPMVAVTTGYWNFYGYGTYELTALLDANQIVIEHRFFGSSRPEPADWTKLTIQQSAADQHRITELLGTIYHQAWLTTGASKGGMTASYHRRFYPDDVDGSVPYVAPLSFSAGDTRYAAFLDTIGPPACRQALRDLEVELLSQPRFDYLLSRAQQQAQNEGWTYTRIAIGPAVESAITGIEWSFWQYVGAGSCGGIPPVTASNATMWDFVDQVSGVTGSSDVYVSAFEAYYYQAAFELGYPDGGGAFLEGLTRYVESDYDGIYPQGAPIPTHVPGAMADIDQWVQTESDRMLFIYGEWDPWTGGRYALGAATDALSLTAPQMTHGAGFDSLTSPDRAAAYSRLQAWTGVTPGFAKPVRTGRLAPPPPEPRIPPAIIRGLQLRARSR
jgi:hypothetical protein